MRKKYQRVIEIEKCQQAVMLARVSSRKQERGASLDAQVESIQAYCHRNDLTIVEPTPKAFVFTESSTRGGAKQPLLSIRSTVYNVVLANVKK